LEAESWESDWEDISLWGREERRSELILRLKKPFKAGDVDERAGCSPEGLLI